ncbi:hypothetical protein MMC34_000452 [Xylographa carneopallida]|nr:hypothetical protein [Xylographa carneopallida]
MAPRAEKSQLKRGRASAGERDVETKKPRRSQRISSQPNTTPLNNNNTQLPSPLTHKESTMTEPYREGTVTPPESHQNHARQHTPLSSPQPSQGLSSPPQDTQAFSQFSYPPQSWSEDVEDEEAEGVWGYLIPLDRKFGDILVLRKRTACPAPMPNSSFGRGSDQRAKGNLAHSYIEEEEKYEENKRNLGFPAGGYLVGRHPECVSNRHCLIFHENKGGDSIAVLEDLSSNGTYVNGAIVGRNKRRELKEADEISVLEETTFQFRYPKNRDSNAFRQQYRVLQQLGKGHFATVYLCVEKASGARFAVKRFEKRPGEKERSATDGLQQEIAVLMSVSHPNMLCLKDTFDEDDGVYLVLELAAEGELFNWIVMKQKLTEQETRKVFVQLFQGMKYLHERNIVHRDLKPENILLIDKDLSVKIADFGLAKIIGEESFTTTLCGTPSYVAPEILENSKHRRYTRAVDVWSLGVVLYICLCGFPPFSDELYSPESPYTLSQQIKLGRFDYPSPYWDSVGDPALDLIDKMLVVDPDKRYSIDECLEHPWITQKVPNPADSTDGLTGAMGQLDFSKRKLARERTLLSSINDVKISKVIPTDEGKGAVKIWEKNANDKRIHNSQPKNGMGPKINGAANGEEEKPSAQRPTKEFMEMGGKGDVSLFAYDGESRYNVAEEMDKKSL